MVNIAKNEMTKRTYKSNVDDLGSTGRYPTKWENSSNAWHRQGGIMTRMDH